MPFNEPRVLTFFPLNIYGNYELTVQCQSKLKAGVPDLSLVRIGERAPSAAKE